MFALLKSSLLLILGFLLIVVIVWFGGPYVAINQWAPLGPPLARLVTIGLIVGIWLAWRLYKRLKAFRTSDRLLAEVVAQPQPDQSRLPADAAKLRERFEEAVATLKQQRRSGHNLYELPWYVIIGAPGSGKTTALLNSGLKFPLEQRVGKGALRGVGGTRNCDWWFTDEAIFLDTAGRYTTQDSDASADSAGWSEFLALLRKYRARRPINGVVLTISAHDLIVQGAAAREAHIEAARRRLEELNQELRIQLPVYLMVTKCDLIAGFAEYFDDLTAEGRAQVWGVTFPYEQTVRNDAPHVFGEEFDALIERLNQRVFDRVEEVRDPRRRTRVFAFPQQVAAIKTSLNEFVTEVFAANRFDGQVLLRGVYFTSGTQDGTSIDRLLGSIGRRFGAEAVSPSTGPGKAYFVERLLKEVMIGESGLAGINRRLEARKAAVQLGAYAATGLVAASGVAVLSVSFSRNRTFLETAGTEVAAFDRIAPANAAAPLDRIVARLDGVRRIVDAADQYRDDTTWAMRWGLYQGSSIGNSARDAYTRELDSLLLPRLEQALRLRIQALSDPEALYQVFKAYMMLGSPEHLDRDHLKRIADEEWAQARVTPVVAQGLSNHLQSLLSTGETIRPLPLDAALVARASASLRQTSMPKILYEALKRTYGEGQPDLRLAEQAGFEFERVLKRKSGLPMTVPHFFTRPVFRDVVRQGQGELVKALAQDAWIWGENAASSLASAGSVMTAVTALYEREYTATWDGLLDDLEFVPFTTIPQTNELLRVVAGPNSPLRSLLRAVADNTTLVDQPPAAGTTPPTPSLLAGARNSLDQMMRTTQRVVGLPSSAQAGATVGAHFQWARQLLAGEKAPLDSVLASIGAIQQQLDTLGPDVAGASPVAILANPSFRALMSALNQQALILPQQIQALVLQIVKRTSATVVETATVEIETQYRQQVLPACRALIANHYPFAASTQPDVQLADFGTVFGYGGTFDKFFVDQLEKQVDTTGPRWSWKPGAAGSSQPILDQLLAARRLREMFFAPGSRTPNIDFYVVMRDLDRDATRFVLQIDGQNLDETHQPPVRKPAKWPGPSSGQTTYAFEGRFYTPPKNYGGPWAWFRFLDDTQDGPPDQQRLRLNVRNRYNQIQITVEPASANRSPFAANDWRRFSCEP